MIHELKTEQKYFESLTKGYKTFEVRVDDRDFQVGDFLALNEITEEKEHTGRCCLVEVTYILRDFELLARNCVAMGIRPCSIMERRYTTVYERNENKSIKLAVFINTLPSAHSPEWCLVGDASAPVLYDPQANELSFCNENKDGKYTVSIATPMTAMAGDEVFRFVDAAKIPRGTQCLLIYLYTKTKAGIYKAERCDCAVKRIAYRECGAVVDFTIILEGAAEGGIFNAAKKQFTPD
ncbi:MAG: DUF3850 domain-containing protein [Ruminococcaceae bacterium]|nr:DUF3850 domain-containing protein [Oscillospiraceae bacterium]